jgi:hypothetical protein
MTAMNKRAKVTILWVILGVLGRLIPHLPNMTPMASLSLYAGSNLRRGAAFISLFGTLFISDCVLAYLQGYPIFSYWSLFTYTGFAAILLFGNILKNNYKLSTVAAFLFISSLGFWLWTNFGVWLTSALYAKTVVGLGMCYLAALPFLRNELIGDLVWGLIIFGFGSARVAELADALDLGSSRVTCESSSLSSRTKKF